MAPPSRSSFQGIDRISHGTPLHGSNVALSFLNPAVVSRLVKNLKSAARGLNLYALLPILELVTWRESFPTKKNKPKSSYMDNTETHRIVSGNKDS